MRERWTTIRGNAVGKMNSYPYTALSKQDIISDENTNDIVDVQKGRGKFSKEAQPRSTRRGLSYIFSILRKLKLNGDTTETHG